ncbi:MAG TPA: YciI family protein [Pseudonocardiaceae bacterium]|nr:YciI family protein [Pseudonocardiaceae bacterium]
MKYIILIHSNPRSRQVFDDMTDDQRHQFARDHRDFGQTLIDTGELIYSEGLVPGDQATWVTIHNGDILATDGPYAETKEYVAGFYVIECPDVQRAIEHAARLPEAAYTQVEVRPVFNMASIGL